MKTKSLYVLQETIKNKSLYAMIMRGGGGGGGGSLSSNYDFVILIFAWTE